MLIFSLVVPCLSVFLAERPTPPAGRFRAGDGHLNLHDYRDNLWRHGSPEKLEGSPSAVATVLPVTPLRSTRSRIA